MKINNFAFFSIALLVSGCSVKGGTTIGPTPPSGGDGGGGTSGTLSVSFSQQPVLEAVRGVSFSDNVEVEFQKNGVAQTPPASSSYSVKAYTNADCSTEGTGTLTFTRTVVGSTLRLSSIKYSSSEDIYVGIVGTGSSVGTACSEKVQVFSSEPAYFTILDGIGSSGVAGGSTTTPVLFKVLNASNQAVKNARLKIEGLVSPASSDTGEISWNIPLPQSALAQSVSASLFSVVNGDLDIQEVAVNVSPDVADSIEIAYQDSPSVVEVNTVSNPISIMAKDKFQNPVRPDLWELTVSAYSDSTCTQAMPPAVADQIFSDLGVDLADPSTFTKLYIYSFDYIGTVYFKFSLLDGTETKSSVCSNPIEITAPAL